MAALRVLEFYSGIGGLRFSLEDSGVNASLVEAFEINDRANDVYEHNFGHRPNQGNIHRLDAKDLDKYRADAWLLSPPCQPYTRQGLQKDSADARASSFLKLVDVLPSLSFPPSHILIENVVGFESSLTRDRCQKVLEAMQYHTAEFILSPLQFGIPYSRPRYFLLARRKPFSFRSSSLDNELMCKPVEAVLETPSGSETTRTNQPELDPYLLCRPLSDYLDLGPDAMQDYMVPSATVERYCHTSIDQVLLLYKELRTVRERDGLPSSYRSYGGYTGHTIDEIGPSVFHSSRDCKLALLPFFFQLSRTYVDHSAICTAGKQSECQSRRLLAQTTLLGALIVTNLGLR